MAMDSDGRRDRRRFLQEGTAALGGAVGLTALPLTAAGAAARPVVVPPRVIVGAKRPSAFLGKPGDFYVDTAMHELYGPKSRVGRRHDGWGRPRALVALTGLTGLRGLTGATGPTGAGGPTAQGVGGATGATGANGADAAGGSGSEYSVLGGAGPPSASVGADGDFFIDTATAQIYGPRSSGSWGSPVSITGPITGEPGGLATLNDSGTLAERQLPSAVVSRRQYASSGSVLDIHTFYPEDYGAHETGDSTKAFQEIIDEIRNEDLGNAKIRCGPKYELLSAPRTDRQGNSIVSLGEHGDAPRILRFEGAVGGTSFVTSQTGSYSNEYGPPSVFGGPTSEVLEAEGLNAEFAGPQIQMFDVNVYLPENPSIAGINLSRIEIVWLDRVGIVGLGDEPEPTHANAFGIYLPEGDGGGSRIGSLTCARVYCGVVSNCAHFVAQFVQSGLCWLALGLTGNEQYSGNDGHSGIVQYLDTERNKYHVGGYSPELGAMSIPVGHPCQMVFGVWDIEDHADGHWNTTTYHLLDTNGQLTGSANYGRVIAFQGPVSGGFLQAGGTNFALTDITQPAPATAQQFAEKAVELPYKTMILADSPVCYYRMDESDGAKDLGELGLSGTPHGTIPTTKGALARSGDLDLANAFSGNAANYFSFADNDALHFNKVFSVEAWVYPTMARQTAGIYEKTIGGEYYSSWLLMIAEGKARVRLSGGKEVEAAEPLNPNAWSHVVGTFDGEHLRLYVNGQPAGQLAASETATGSGESIIGAMKPNAPLSPMAGAIDEVAIYGTTLAATRVREHYEAGTR